MEAKRDHINNAICCPKRGLPTVFPPPLHQQARAQLLTEVSKFLLVFQLGQ